MTQDLEEKLPFLVSSKSEMNPFGVRNKWLTKKGLPFWKIARNGRIENDETTLMMW